MTQFCYVKSGLGTSTSATTFSALESGAFGSGNLTAANTYASLAVALSSNTLVAGDWILFSDLHSVLASADVTHTIPEGLNLASVDDNNADAAATTGKAAIEGTTGASSQLFLYSSVQDSGITINYFSMIIKAGDPVQFSGTHHMYDCELSLGDLYLRVVGNGSHLKFLGGSVTMSNLENYIRAGYGAFHRFVGANFLLITASRINKFIVINGSGGGSAEFIGCDLSELWDGTSTGPIVEVDVSSDDVCFVRFVRCKLPATDPSGGRVSSGTNGVFEVDFIGCGDGSNGEFEIERYRYQGDMTSEVGTSHFRSGDSKLPDDTNYLSFKLSSNANASRTAPLRVFAPMRFEDDYSSNGKVTLYVSGPASLLNSEFWVEPMYADGTDPELWRRVHSSKTGSDGRIDPIGTGAALTADGTNWTGGGTNDYSIETTLASGGDGLVGVWLCLGKASTDVYVSSTVNLHS